MPDQPASESGIESNLDAKTPAAAEPGSGPALQAKAKAASAAKGEGAAAAKPTGNKAPPAAGKPAAKAPGAEPAKAAPMAVEDRPRAGTLGPWVREVIRATPSWLVSAVVHMVAILVLALLTLPPAPARDARQLVVAPDEDEALEVIEDLDDQPLDDIELVEVSDLVFESQIEQPVMDVSPFEDMEAAVSMDLSDIGLEHAPKSDLLERIGAFSGGDLDGRGSGKQKLVAQVGGTDASERAVALALQWLAGHQLPDGSWSFDHTLCPKCRGQCRNPGEIPKARNGATGMALLPFLGAGQTPNTGKYKDQVKAGLYFLVNHMKVSPQGGSLFEQGGSMYSHGLASIALCEAYAMTHEKGLYVPAQQALNFIAYAQDPVGGGWRYNPRQPGDTSVVGWQIMAMKSGHMAYLRVPPITVQKASRYLDSVQANNGAHYGYTDPAAGREATTAIGLLCRMYLGWKKDNRALEQGVKWISQKGPSKNNMYYNYYATQVMRHWEGELWDKWNNVMRDQLVRSQAQKGHEQGSWFMEAGHATDKGGRLYCTCMAAMVLEVYYRHLPIYRKQSTEEDFPID